MSFDASPFEMANEARRQIASLPRIDAPSVRSIQKSYSRMFSTLPAKWVYRFVCSLLNEASWAERVVAWEVLASHPGAFQLLNDNEVQKMARGLNDWASVDLFGVTVLGQAWRKGLVSDEQIQTWSRSPDRWLRRLALVATVPLNSKARGGSGDGPRTLCVCSMLIDDRDDMVVKASSWALRELSKRDPQIVWDFVAQYSERIAPRVKREVHNKLTTGRKQK